MNIRRYKNSDAQKLWELVYNTIHTINFGDYSQAQVDAWAPASVDFTWWQKELNTKQPFIIEFSDEIVGYADIQNNGFIHHFFCDHRYQRQGIGSMLLKYLITQAINKEIEKIIVEASITARPFFEYHGFNVIKPVDAELRGQIFRIYLMEKLLKCK